MALQQNNEKVTLEAYKPGEKPVARVKPIQRTFKNKDAKIATLQPNQELQDFLEKYDITSLEDLFMAK